MKDVALCGIWTCAAFKVNAGTVTSAAAIKARILLMVLPSS
jgi:hypothetical protein